MLAAAAAAAAVDDEEDWEETLQGAVLRGSERECAAVAERLSVLAGDVRGGSWRWLQALSALRRVARRHPRELRADVLPRILPQLLTLNTLGERDEETDAAALEHVQAIVALSAAGAADLLLPHAPELMAFLVHSVRRAQGVLPVLEIVLVMLRKETFARVLSLADRDCLVRELLVQTAHELQMGHSELIHFFVPVFHTLVEQGELPLSCLSALIVASALVLFYDSNAAWGLVRGALGSEIYSVSAMSALVLLLETGGAVAQPTLLSTSRMTASTTNTVTTATASTAGVAAAAIAVTDNANRSNDVRVNMVIHNHNMAMLRRGCVFFLSMALWGADSIVQLRDFRAVSISVLRAVLVWRDAEVLMEVAFSIRRLVKKHGGSFTQEWQHVVGLIHDLIEISDELCLADEDMLHQLAAHLQHMQQVHVKFVEKRERHRRRQLRREQRQQRVAAAAAAASTQSRTINPPTTIASTTTSTGQVAALMPTHNSEQPPAELFSFPPQQQQQQQQQQQHQSHSHPHPHPQQQQQLHAGTTNSDDTATNASEESFSALAVHAHAGAGDGRAAANDNDGSASVISGHSDPSTTSSAGHLPPQHTSGQQQLLSDNITSSNSGNEFSDDVDAQTTERDSSKDQDTSTVQSSERRVKFNTPVLNLAGATAAARHELQQPSVTRGDSEESCGHLKDGRIGKLQAVGALSPRSTMGMIESRIERVLADIEAAQQSAHAVTEHLNFLGRVQAEAWATLLDVCRAIIPALENMPIGFEHMDALTADGHRSTLSSTTTASAAGSGLGFGSGPTSVAAPQTQEEAAVVLDTETKRQLFDMLWEFRRELPTETAVGVIRLGMHLSTPMHRGWLDRAKQTAREFFSHTQHAHLRLHVLDGLQRLVDACDGDIESTTRLAEQVVLPVMSVIHADADGRVRKRGLGVIAYLYEAAVKPESRWSLLQALCGALLRSDFEDAATSALRFLLTLFNGGRSGWQLEQQHALRVANVLVQAVHPSGVQSSILGTAMADVMRCFARAVGDPLGYALFPATPQHAAAAAAALSVSGRSAHRQDLPQSLPLQSTVLVLPTCVGALEAQKRSPAEGAHGSTPPPPSQPQHIQHPQHPQSQPQPQQTRVDASRPSVKSDQLFPTARLVSNMLCSVARNLAALVYVCSNTNTASTTASGTGSTKLNEPSSSMGGNKDHDNSGNHLRENALERSLLSVFSDDTLGRRKSVHKSPDPLDEAGGASAAATVTKSSDREMQVDVSGDVGSTTADYDDDDADDDPDVVDSTHREATNHANAASSSSAWFSSTKSELRRVEQVLVHTLTCVDHFLQDEFLVSADTATTVVNEWVQFILASTECCLEQVVQRSRVLHPIAVAENLDPEPTLRERQILEVKAMHAVSLGRVWRLLVHLCRTCVQLVHLLDTGCAGKITFVMFRCAQACLDLGLYHSAIGEDTLLEAPVVLRNKVQRLTRPSRYGRALMHGRTSPVFDALSTTSAEGKASSAERGRGPPVDGAAADGSSIISTRSRSPLGTDDWGREEARAMLLGDAIPALCELSTLLPVVLLRECALVMGFLNSVVATMSSADYVPPLQRQSPPIGPHVGEHAASPSLQPDLTHTDTASTSLLDASTNAGSSPDEDNNTATDAHPSDGASVPHTPADTSTHVAGVSSADARTLAAQSASDERSATPSQQTASFAPSSMTAPSCTMTEGSAAVTSGSAAARALPSPLFSTAGRERESSPVAHQQHSQQQQNPQHLSQGQGSPTPTSSRMPDGDRLKLAVSVMRMLLALCSEVARACDANEVRRQDALQDHDVSHIVTVLAHMLNLSTLTWRKDAASSSTVRRVVDVLAVRALAYLAGVMTRRQCSHASRILGRFLVVEQAASCRLAFDLLATEQQSRHTIHSFHDETLMSQRFTARSNTLLMRGISSLVSVQVGVGPDKGWALVVHRQPAGRLVWRLRLPRTVWNADPIDSLGLPHGESNDGTQETDSASHNRRGSAPNAQQLVDIGSVLHGWLRPHTWLRASTTHFGARPHAGMGTGLRAAPGAVPPLPGHQHQHLQYESNAGKDDESSQSPSPLPYARSPTPTSFLPVSREERSSRPPSASSTTTAPMPGTATASAVSGVRVRNTTNAQSQLPSVQLLQQQQQQQHQQQRRRRSSTRTSPAKLPAEPARDGLQSEAWSASDNMRTDPRVAMSAAAAAATTTTTASGESGKGGHSRVVFKAADPVREAGVSGIVGGAAPTESSSPPPPMRRVSSDDHNEATSETDLSFTSDDEDVARSWNRSVSSAKAASGDLVEGAHSLHSDAVGAGTGTAEHTGMMQVAPPVLDRGGSDPLLAAVLSANVESSSFDNLGRRYAAHAQAIVAFDDDLDGSIDLNPVDSSRHSTDSMSESHRSSGLDYDGIESATSGSEFAISKDGWGSDKLSLMHRHVPDEILEQWRNAPVVGESPQAVETAGAAAPTLEVAHTMPVSATSVSASQAPSDTADADDDDLLEMESSSDEEGALDECDDDDGDDSGGDGHANTVQNPGGDLPPGASLSCAAARTQAGARTPNEGDDQEEAQAPSGTASTGMSSDGASFRGEPNLASPFRMTANSSPLSQLVEDDPVLMGSPHRGTADKQRNAPEKGDGLTPRSPTVKAEPRDLPRLAAVAVSGLPTPALSRRARSLPGSPVRPTDGRGTTSPGRVPTDGSPSRIPPPVASPLSRAQTAELVAPGVWKALRRYSATGASNVSNELAMKAHRQQPQGLPHRLGQHPPRGSVRSSDTMSLLRVPQPLPPPPPQGRIRSISLHSPTSGTSPISSPSFQPLPGYDDTLPGLALPSAATATDTETMSNATTATTQVASSKSGTSTAVLLPGCATERMATLQSCRREQDDRDSSSSVAASSGDPSASGSRGEERVPSSSSSASLSPAIADSQQDQTNSTVNSTDAPVVSPATAAPTDLADRADDAQAASGGDSGGKTAAVSDASARAPTPQRDAVGTAVTRLGADTSSPALDAEAAGMKAVLLRQLQAPGSSCAGAAAPLPDEAAARRGHLRGSSSSGDASSSVLMGDNVWDADEGSESRASDDMDGSDCGLRLDVHQANLDADDVHAGRPHAELRQGSSLSFGGDPTADAMPIDLRLQQHDPPRTLPGGRRGSGERGYRRRHTMSAAVADLARRGPDGDGNADGDADFVLSNLSLFVPGLAADVDTIGFRSSAEAGNSMSDDQRQSIPSHQVQASHSQQQQQVPLGVSTTVNVRGLPNANPYSTGTSSHSAGGVPISPYLSTLPTLGREPETAQQSVDRRRRRSESQVPMFNASVGAASRPMRGTLGNSTGEEIPSSPVLALRPPAPAAGAHVSQGMFGVASPRSMSPSGLSHHHHRSRSAAVTLPFRRQAPLVQLVAEDENVTRALNVLDRTPTFETHKIAVLLRMCPPKSCLDRLRGPSANAASKAGQISGEDAPSPETPSSRSAGATPGPNLAGQGSLEFVQFASELGNLVPVSRLSAYAAGLDTARDTDGEYALVDTDACTVTVFHVPFLLTGSEHSRTKHLGNDFVRIVYLAGGGVYEDGGPDEEGVGSAFGLLLVLVRRVAWSAVAHAVGREGPLQGDETPSPSPVSGTKSPSDEALLGGHFSFHVEVRVNRQCDADTAGLLSCLEGSQHVGAAQLGWYLHRLCQVADVLCQSVMADKIGEPSNWFARQAQLELVRERFGADSVMS